ncbi:MAG TPA: hypothetical protein VGR26_07415 [Acidimicrobiales bacterium]|nr:hypothetical protein [Acidimicrobiales bacterium]
MRRGWRRRGLLIVAAVDVVVLALAMAVVVWHGTPWTPPLPGAREPVVAALADFPQEQANSARWSVMVLSETSGSSGLLTGSTGEVDFTSDRWHGTFQVGEGAPTEEFFVEGNAQYRRKPGGEWRMSSRRARELFFSPLPFSIIGRSNNDGSPLHPPSREDRRRIVDALMVSLANEGWTRVRGELATHVEVTLDGDGLYRAIQEGRVEPGLRDEAASWTSLVSRRVELEVWVDGKGRQRRLDFLDPPPEPAGEDVPSLRIIQEWWDFDGPGRLAPPADLPAAPSS